MKILRTQLHGFGAFNRGLEVRFAPEGLNLIVGRNEAGKSTLMNAVVGVLFGFRDLNLVRKYEPWDAHDAYSGEVDVLADDGRTLRFYRDFKTQLATIDELRNGEILPLFHGSADPRGARDEDQTYFECLGKVMGLKDEAVFRNTVFFGQQSLQTSVSDQIRRLISGSTTVDYKGALHELHSRYSELTTENPWKTKGRGARRLIEETRSSLHDERARLEGGRQTLARSAELEDEAESRAAAIAANEREAEELRQSLEISERLFALLARREDATRRYDETLARRDSFQRYADRTAQLEDRLHREFSTYRNAPDDLAELARTLAVERTELERDTETLATERKALAGLRPVPNQNAGLLTGIAVAAAAAAGGFMTPLAGPAAFILGFALFPLGFLAGRHLGTGFKDRKAALTQKIHTLESQVALRRRRTEDILEQAGPALAGRNPEDVVREAREFHALREERRRLLAAMKALGDRAQVEAAFNDAARERGAVDAALDDLRQEHPAFSAPDRAAVARRVDDLRARGEQLASSLRQDRARLEACRLELAELGARMDFDVAAMEENVREKERRLVDYDLERDALKEAIDTLDACIKEFQEGDVFRLSEEISAIFSRITGDKYSRVHLGASLEPVISRGDRIPISPADLSQGAQDQLYFAMRVAMARHLCRDVRLPLFLDDPFVNFDAERLAVTRDVLCNLDGHQVIMVTCNRDYESWTPTTVDLDRAR